MNRIVEKIKNIFFKREYFQETYSQTGEDIIVNFIFTLRGVTKPTYMDIGAFHPMELSNTYFFYKKGSRGICIEPNPINYELFKKQRCEDENLQYGIGPISTNLTYFCFSDATLNTFDKKTAYELVDKFNHNIISENNVDVKTISEVLNGFNKKSFPDFLSLDVEGLDLQILKSINYENISECPKVICVETIEYTLDGTGKKNQELIDFLKSNGYFLFADTFINSIFVNEKFWNV